MNSTVQVREVVGSMKVVLAAVAGAVGGLVVTAVVLGSVPFGILGGIGTAVVSMIAALARVERAEM
jgi:hypothetical protein